MSHHGSATISALLIERQHFSYGEVGDGECGHRECSPSGIPQTPRCLRPICSPYALVSPVANTGDDFMKSVFFFSFSRKTFDVQHISKFMLHRLSYFNRKEFLFVLLQTEGKTTNPHMLWLTEMTTERVNEPMG